MASTSVDPEARCRRRPPPPRTKSSWSLPISERLDGKGGLAASVAEMCLASKTDLTDHELELAFEILRLLTDKVEVKIRRHIADYLAERHDVPQDLIQFLANDEITVAYPIILHSREFCRKATVLALIANRSSRHRQAVAIRPGISSTITDKLVEFDEPDVLTTLLCNETADISHESMTQAGRTVARCRFLPRAACASQGTDAGAGAKNVCLGRRRAAPIHRRKFRNRFGRGFRIGRPKQSTIRWRKTCRRKANRPRPLSQMSPSEMQPGL